MKTIEKSKKNQLPKWQSDRMKSLIEERWSEVWKIVVERQSYQKRDHLRGLQ